MFNAWSNARNGNFQVVVGHMGRLTTHVLDTERGRAASGIRIEVLSLAGPQSRTLCEAVTNMDGRTSTPLLEGAALAAGVYEIHFHVGPYLDKTRGEDSSRGFLDTIVIRFAVSAPDEHYHVPLLLQGAGYTTYRGT